MTATQLVSLRYRMGWTQREAATRFGVSKRTLSRWETGAAPIPMIASKLYRLLVLIQQT